MHTDSQEIVRIAVQNVLTDDGFNLPSEAAWKAKETAEKLLEWSGDSENH